MRFFRKRKEKGGFHIPGETKKPKTRDEVLKERYGIEKRGIFRKVLEFLLKRKRGGEK